MATWARVAVVPIALERLVVACSGPHARETIAANERLGWLLWAATAVVVVAFAVERLARLRTWRGIGAPVMLSVRAVHRAWVRAPRGGRAPTQATEKARAPPTGVSEARFKLLDQDSNLGPGD